MDGDLYASPASSDSADDETVLISRREYDEMRAALAEKDRELESKDANLRGLQGQRELMVACANETAMNLGEKNARLQRHYDKVREENDTIKQVNNELRDEVAQNGAMLDAYDMALQRLENRCTSMLTCIDRWRSHSEQLEQSLRDSSERVCTLEEAAEAAKHEIKASRRETVLENREKRRLGRALAAEQLAANCIIRANEIVIDEREKQIADLRKALASTENRLLEEATPGTSEDDCTPIKSSDTNNVDDKSTVDNS